MMTKRDLQSIGRLKTGAVLPIVDDDGEELCSAEPCRCELCGGPTDQDGETTAYNGRDQHEVVTRIAQAIWDHPQTMFVALSTAILGKSGVDIARKFGQLTGREVTRQNIHHHKVMIVRIWPELAPSLFIRKHETNDKGAAGE